MSGWIKIHRQLTSHWIWDNSDYLKWWIDIIIEVNYDSQKVLIKGVLFECKKGEKLYSLDTWAKRWKTNKSKVKRFLDLLQKEGMIELKNETVTTRLKVNKYEDYQDSSKDSETQTKRKRNANETQTKPIKEDKEIKEDIENRKLKFADTLKPFLEKYGREFLLDFYGYWTEPNRSGTKFRQENEKAWDVERRLSTWSKNEKTFSKPKEQPKKLIL